MDRTRWFVWGSMLLVLAACDGTPTCMTDDNCESGAHCALGRCITQCTQDTECAGFGPAATCAVDRGRCILGGGTDGGRPDAGSVACAANRDCADGVFCNGVETCEPGAEGADGRGCVPGTAPCVDGEMCEESREECVAVGCETPDADGDGSLRRACGGDDCDDADGNRFPGNLEVCDDEAHDEDCDPTTFGFRDNDGDGYLDAACCNEDDEGTRTCGDDCDDTRLIRNPGRLEVCDTFDNDCDEMTDESVVPTFYADTDGDGFGTPDTSVSQCLAPLGYVDLNTDCDDEDRSINPAAREVCDGVDNNCDELTDAADATVDECLCIDGQVTECGVSMMGACRLGERRCGADGRYGACEGNIDPRPEGCNGVDDDCDGSVDEGVITVCFRDGDGDGYGRDDDTVSTCGTCPEDYVTRGGDCNDGRADTHSGASEFCDGRDNDCSDGGGADSGEDADGDGFAPLAAACFGGYPRTDCRDDNAEIFGGVQPFMEAPFCPESYTWCAEAGSGGCCVSDTVGCSAGATCCTSRILCPLSYDYDCDGLQTQQPIVTGTCTWRTATGGDPPRCIGSGPTTLADTCFSEVSYVSCQLTADLLGCNTLMTTRRPGCR